MSKESRPFKKAIPYGVSITPSHNGGFLVEVGCVNLVYEFIPELLDDLRQYLEDPGRMVRKYKTEYNDSLMERAQETSPMATSVNLLGGDDPCPQP